MISIAIADMAIVQTRVESSPFTQIVIPLHIHNIFTDHVSLTGIYVVHVNVF